MVVMWWLRPKCEFNLATLEIGVVETAEHIPDVFESLDREYILDSDDNEYEVCTNCHEKVLKTQWLKVLEKLWKRNDIVKMRLNNFRKLYSN